MLKKNVRHRLLEGKGSLEMELRQLNRLISAPEKHYHLWNNRSGGKPSFHKWGKFPKSWDQWSNNWDKQK